MPMPRWKCHKTVEAFKIAKIEAKPGGAILHAVNIEKPSDTGAVFVPSHWVEKHEPHEGGYFVRYEDGYISFSPAEAFEAGYTRIED